MDLKRLREETQPEHEATEASMPLMDPALSLATYTETLASLLPLVRSWELWAAGHVPASLRSLLTERRRGHLLAADLQALNAPEPLSAAPIDWGGIVQGTAVAANMAQDGPEFEAAFLGALYVFEGSTLGGRFIARHVQELLGVDAGNGAAFFEGHGQGTGALWRETTTAVAAVPEQYSPLVVEAARRTFQTFRTVMRLSQRENSSLGTS